MARRRKGAQAGEQEGGQGDPEAHDLLWDKGRAVGERGENVAWEAGNLTAKVWVP